MIRTVLISRAAVGALTTVLAVVATSIAATPAHAFKDDLLLVSAPLAAPFALDGSSYASDVSADGRYVAFHSDASTLAPAVTDGDTRVYVKDLVTGQVELVSQSNTGEPAAEESVYPSISADGRYVAFSSTSGNLVPGVPASPDSHVFVRDRLDDKTVVVDRSENDVLGTGRAEWPSISADGRNVAFVSESSNLVPNADDPDVYDAFVKNLDTGAIVLLSRASGTAGQRSNGDVVRVALSADATQAAFTTYATNLGANNGHSKVYRRGTSPDGSLALISRGSGTNGAVANGDASAPALSADGDVVAFDSRASNLSGQDADGTLDVFVRKVSATTLTLVSRANGFGGAAGDADSHSASVSADGAKVAFTSESENLATVHANSAADVFVRDREAQTTTHVSREGGSAGAPGIASSFEPALSDDGTWVAFTSFADNLSDVDNDGESSVFARGLVGERPPSPPATPTPAAPQPAVSAPGGAVAGTARAGGSVARPVAFRVLGLRASTSRFKSRRGTRVLLRSSKAARVRLTLERRVGRRWKRVGHVDRRMGRKLEITVKRRFAGKRLIPGRYRLIAALRDVETGKRIRSRGLVLRVIR